jgi:hypothetical protein
MASSFGDGSHDVGIRVSFENPFGHSLSHFSTVRRDDHISIVVYVVVNKPHLHRHQRFLDSRTNTQTSQKPPVRAIMTQSNMKLKKPYRRGGRDCR